MSCTVRLSWEGEPEGGVTAKGLAKKLSKLVGDGAVERCRIKGKFIPLKEKVAGNSQQQQQQQQQWQSLGVAFVTFLLPEEAQEIVAMLGEKEGVKLRGFKGVAAALVGAEAAAEEEEKEGDRRGMGAEDGCGEQTETSVDLELAVLEMGFLDAGGEDGKGRGGKGVEVRRGERRGRNGWQGAQHGSDADLCVAWQSEKDSVRASFDFERRRLRLLLRQFLKQPAAGQQQHEWNHAPQHHVLYSLDFRFRDLRLLGHGPHTPMQQSLLFRCINLPRVFLQRCEDDEWSCSSISSIGGQMEGEGQEPWVRCVDPTQGCLQMSNILNLRASAVRQGEVVARLEKLLRRESMEDRWWWRRVQLREDNVKVMAPSKGLQLLPFLSIDPNLMLLDPERRQMNGNSRSLHQQQQQPQLLFDLIILVIGLAQKGIIPISQLPAVCRMLHSIAPWVAEAALLHFYDFNFPEPKSAEKFQQVMAVVEKLHIDCNNRSHKMPNSSSSSSSNSNGNGSSERKEGQMSASGARHLGSDHALVWHMAITPLGAQCMPPVLALHNRVTRHFSHLKDHFMRVTFMEEDLSPLTSYCLRDRQLLPGGRKTKLGKSSIYHRIRQIVNEGFHLAGRHYRFLAASASQSRECSAWFFAAYQDPLSDQTINVDSIRCWMGSFNSIRNVAKFSARLGQCFSDHFTTLPLNPQQVQVIRDVTRNGRLFTDGCGIVSSSMASKLHEQVKQYVGPLDGEGSEPAAYQVRIGGAKGVVSIMPDEEARGRYGGEESHLWLRDSMVKFESMHCSLEVLNWSRFMPCYLNRQIITLLSTLGVPDDVFIKLQDAFLTSIYSTLLDPNSATEHLSTSLGSDETTGIALAMLRGGIHPAKDPFLKAMLTAIRSMQLQDLLSKARIFVPRGRWMLGVVDERNILEYGQCFIRVTGPNSEGITGQPFVVSGRVVFAKNPCLHPGDVRLLQAVDCPQLYEVTNCLVLPQRGPRSHANEASGSDFDGDVFFVTWDEQLLPEEDHEPMEYEAVEGKKTSGEVTMQMVHDNFVDQMLNDDVGIICNAHVVHADVSSTGAACEACITLAKEAAKAIDFPKTGVAGVMDERLRPKMYPDFMQKEDKPTYESSKVLGKLFRKVRKVLEGSSVEEEAEEEEEEGDEKERRELQAAMDKVGGDDKGTQVSAVEVARLRRQWHARRVVRAKRSGVTWGELGGFYDAQLMVEGYEEHVEEARKLRDCYEVEVLSLMQKLGLASEAELVTATPILAVSSRDGRFGSLKTRAKDQYSALFKRFRGFLLTRGGSNRELVKENGLDFEGAEQEEEDVVEGQPADKPVEEGMSQEKSTLWGGLVSWLMNPFQEEPQPKAQETQEKQDGGVPPTERLLQRACSWYHVVYHPDEVKLRKAASEQALMSFAWIGVDLLLSNRSKSTAE